MLRDQAIPAVRRRQTLLAALVLLSLVAAMVHLAAAHDRISCACGVPHAHSGLSLQASGTEAGPPPLDPSPPPRWTTTLVHQKRFSPFKPLRAPPANPIQGCHLPA